MYIDKEYETIVDDYDFTICNCSVFDDYIVVQTLLEVCSNPS